MKTEFWNNSTNQKMMKLEFWNYSTKQIMCLATEMIDLRNGQLLCKNWQSQTRT